MCAGAPLSRAGYFRARRAPSACHARRRNRALLTPVRARARSQAPGALAAPQLACPPALRSAPAALRAAVAAARQPVYSGAPSAVGGTRPARLQECSALSRGCGAARKHAAARAAAAFPRARSAKPVRCCALVATTWREQARRSYPAAATDCHLKCAPVAHQPGAGSHAPRAADPCFQASRQ